MTKFWKAEGCDEDDDCPSRQYCYKISRRCVNYILCSTYYRHEAQKLARDASQCGPCINGYVAEMFLSGENSTLCRKIAHENDTFAEMDEMKWMWLSIAIIIGAFIAILCIFGFLKQYRDKFKVTKRNNPDNEMISASAPPEEHSPFIGYHKAKYALSYNNNKNLINNNKFSTATPHVAPGWISGPNFDPDGSDNDETDTPNAHGNVSQPARNDNHDLNNSGQLTIELPELTIEQEDNSINTELMKADTLHDTSNNDSNDSQYKTNDNRRSPNGIRISNVLINQNIAMNLRVINGDQN